MDQTTLLKVCSKAGVHGGGMVDAVRRGQEHFGETEPDAAALDAWSATLKTEAPHLFPVPGPVLPEGIQFSAIERLTRLRPPPPEKHVAPQPPAALAQQWQSLAPVERLTAVRAWQAEQGKETNVHHA